MVTRSEEKALEEHKALDVFRSMVTQRSAYKLEELEREAFVARTTGTYDTSAFETRLQRLRDLVS